MKNLSSYRFFTVLAWLFMLCLSSCDSEPRQNINNPVVFEYKENGYNLSFEYYMKTIDGTLATAFKTNEQFIVGLKCINKSNSKITHTQQQYLNVTDSFRYCYDTDGEKIAYAVELYPTYISPTSIELDGNRILEQNIAIYPHEYIYCISLRKDKKLRLPKGKYHVTYTHRNFIMFSDFMHLDATGIDTMTIAFPSFKINFTVF